MGRIIQYITSSSICICLLVSTSVAAKARYNESFYGKLCDKHMGNMAADKSLKIQYNFAMNCLLKIKEEAGRDHDAYMLWISNIKNSEGNSKEALEWGWWAIGATQLNNHLDGRSPNDFMSIAYISLLLHMTGGLRDQRSLGTSLSAHDAKTSHDLSLATMKISGCNNSQKMKFINESTISPSGSPINFSIVDRTLSAQDKRSHCALSSSVNLLSRMAMTNSKDYVVACQEASPIVKALSDKQYKGFRESIGALYTRMVARLSDGKCKLI